MSGSAPAIPLTQSQMKDFKGNYWLCRCKTTAQRREEEESRAQACLDKEVQTGSLFSLTRSENKVYI